MSAGLSFCPAAALSPGFRDAQSANKPTITIAGLFDNGLASPVRRETVKRRNVIYNNILQDVSVVFMQERVRKLLVSRWLLAAFCILAVPHGATAGSSVVNVRYGVYPDKTRVVLDLDAAAAYQVEPQTQPDRIAIDLKDCAADLDSTVAAAGRGLVKSIHAEAGGPDGSRLVFDLSAPAHLIAAQFLPAADGAPPRIFLDLQAGFAGPKPAAAEAAAPVPQATANVAPVPSKPVPD
ncbi:MAG TPA: AMIN domain-containing protein, partial [Methylomirabilota bacterium]|nr:AMIN domain-containing protein [Methylomirabilota bacterium]